MKRSLKEIMQMKDWVLLAALVVAIVALVLLITPREETIDTVTVIPPPSQIDVAESDLEASSLSAQSMQVLPATQVAMPDAKLLAWFNSKLSRPATQALTQADIESVVNGLPDYATGAGAQLNDISSGTPTAVSAKYLDMSGQQITNLAGLEVLGLMSGTNIAVNLNTNAVTDIAPLGIPNLVYLNANTNQIKDIAPLVRSTNLLELYVNNNQIQDITVLAGLGKLHSLGIANNQVMSADALKNHYMANLNLSGNRLGALRMAQYIATPSTYPAPTTLELANNYINVLDPNDLSLGLRQITSTKYFPQYKMDMYDQTGALVPVNAEIGSGGAQFRLLRRATNDGVTFGLTEIIPGAQILPAYPRDAKGNEEKHKVDFTFDPQTGILTATPKSYGKQIVSFYLWGIDSSFTRVTIEFNVLMSK